MLYGLFVLLASQLIGEAVTRLLALPVPGPVIGIVLLVLYQAAVERWRAASADEVLGPVRSTSDSLLGYLGLMFVPAGVGIAQSYGSIQANAVALITILVVSTIITLLVTVATFRLAARLVEGRRG